VGSAVTGAVPHLRDAAEAECVGDQGHRLNTTVMTSPEQKKNNLRLALILASIAAVLFVGFVAKAALFGI
jgi:hypothetical protein